MSQLRTCAIIPARGGSKSIPRKNLRVIAGRPLLAYVLEASQLAATVARTVVSTDDDEIGDLARQLGADAIPRPSEISGDTATSESALVHALDFLRDHESYEPDLVVFLQATSPLLRSGDIDGAVQTLLREDADSLFSGFRASLFAWRVASDSVSPLNYDPEDRPRRQDLDHELINENGAIYVFKPSVLRTTNSRLGGKVVPYVMDALDSFELDEPDDWATVESLLELRRGTS